MALISLDTECTGVQRPSGATPFNPQNKMVCLSIVKSKDDKRNFKFEYDETNPVLVDVRNVQQEVDAASAIVMMNAKFDYAWCDRYGINLRNKKLWDIQVFHFIQLRQTTPYPSLNQIAEYWGLPTKLDVVKTEYWEQGLDTDQVPWDILSEYCDHDTWLTLEIAKRQMAYYRKNMSRKQQALVKCAMLDIHNLAEMERSGFYYDHAVSQELCQKAEERIRELQAEIRSLLGVDQFPEEVADHVNLGSNDHLSALLYGGVIKYVSEESYVFHYARDAKPPVVKTRKVPSEWQCPRLITPIPNSALAKEGYYSTNEDTLRKVKVNKKMQGVIEKLLELSKTEKLVGTYYAGFPKLLEKMGWGNVVHSTFNQCRAATGRLSSDKPNLQNIPKVHKVCFVSRFDGEFDVSLPTRTS